MRRWLIAVLVGELGLVTTGPCFARDWQRTPQLWLDLGLQAAQPAALQAGLAMGPMLQARRDLAVRGPFHLRAGVRLGWQAATEYTRSFAVRHDQAVLQVMVELARPIGRGEWFVRLGGGGTGVWESRNRHQAERLGTAAAAELGSEAFAVLASSSAELGVALRLARAVALSVSAGPVASVRSQGPSIGAAGWLGVSWLP